MPDVQSFHHDGPKNMNGLWWKIKKIIGGKINSEPPPYLNRHFEGWGRGRLKKTYGHLLYCIQEVSNQIMLLTSYMKW